jgi:hypothetical protein
MLIVPVFEKRKILALIEIAELNFMGKHIFLHVFKISGLSVKVLLIYVKKK